MICYHKSMNSYENRAGNEEPYEPTEEEIEAAMRDTAAQFGEKFEINRDPEPDSDLVARMDREGWRLADIITTGYAVSAEDHPGEDIKIIGRGKKFFVFEREKKEENGDNTGE